MEWLLEPQPLDVCLQLGPAREAEFASELELDVGESGVLTGRSPLAHALGMATQRRERRDGLVIHSDRGVQFTSWAFSQNVRDAGIAPSMGAVGSAFDNAMMESFSGRMQVELFNRRRWKTRIELASAIHDYIELWHNTRRRYSSLGMLTPSEIETVWAAAHNDDLAPTSFAKTAPTVLVDESTATGLSETSQTKASLDHQHLLLDSNHAG